MIWTILIAILFFSLIIFVHELGHFLTARLFKVKVHEFAIGMGPKLISWGKGETKYSVRAIPVGGFCSMEGEDSDSDDEGSFSKKPWYARLIILASGAAMNIVLGFVICVIYVAIVSSNSGVPSTVVSSVVEGSDAADFIQPGDRIVKINGQKTNIIEDITFIMQRNGSKEFEITVDRNGEKLTKTLKPFEDKYEDGTSRYLVGFTGSLEKPTPFNVLREAFYETVWTGKIVFVSLRMLISGEAGMNEVSGPVGVVSVMNDAVQPGGLAGLLNILYIATLISVNIGIMNLLPIPALDGGRILFVIIEAIRRKPIPPEKEGMVHAVGMILLFGIMIFATWNDIMRLFTGH